jgi:DNA-directed RNA polymerase subunit M/transcription elongation factor TFIIS
MLLKADKQCPKCASKNYRFRARRNLAADSVMNTPAVIETKYECSTCGHVWKVQVSEARP